MNRTDRTCLLVIIIGLALLCCTCLLCALPVGMAEASQGTQPRIPVYTITHWANVYDVNPDLAQAILYTESYGDPNALGSLGERGYMQIMTGTAAYISNSTGIPVQKILTDPSTNIRAGIWYFSLWFHRFDDVPKALAAYNGGPLHVINCDCVPENTKRYVEKVHGFWGQQFSVALPIAPPIDYAYLERMGVE